MKAQRLLPLFFSLLAYGKLIAQNNTIVVKAGSTIQESVPVPDLYAYPQFTPGRVFFRDGSGSTAAMNYNRFLDEMQFISTKGDTLAVSNETDIRFIAVGTDTFFYDRGYIQLVKNAGSAKLGVKQTLRIADKRKIESYGMASPTTSIESYRSLNDGLKTYNITVMQDVLLAKNAQYYIGDSTNHFVVATKNNLTRLFPNQRQQVAGYLKENTVVFTNKEDLQKLVQDLAKPASNQ